MARDSLMLRSWHFTHNPQIWFVLTFVNINFKCAERASEHCWDITSISPEHMYHPSITKPGWASGPGHWWLLQTPALFGRSGPSAPLHAFSHYIHPASQEGALSSETGISAVYQQSVKVVWFWNTPTIYQPFTDTFRKAEKKGLRALDKGRKWERNSWLHSAFPCSRLQMSCVEARQENWC